MKAIDQKQDPAVDAINQRLKNIRFKATAGPHRVAVAFRQRTFAESEDRLVNYVPGGGQDRVLRVNAFELRGPYGVTGVSPFPSRERVFTCYPKSVAEESPCAERILTGLAHRAFRRPVQSADTAGLMRIYAAGRQSADFDEGVRRGIAAVLAHPSFLYRSDAPAEGMTAANAWRISDLSLASRLSFFLWSSLPDDELLDVASRGQLHEPKVLEQQVRRMIADKRADSLGEQLRLPVAERREARGARSRSGGLSVCDGPGRSARGFPHRAAAVPLDDLPRGPQRARAAELEGDLAQRAPRASLRSGRRARQPVPARTARRIPCASACSARARR